MNGKKARALRKSMKDRVKELEQQMNALMEGGYTDQELIRRTKILFRENRWFCGNVEDYQFWVTTEEDGRQQIHFSKHSELGKSKRGFRL